MKYLILIFLFITSLFSETKNITLDEAIVIANKNNKQNKISKIALEIAKVQYEKALSANYPALNALVLGQRANDASYLEMKGSIDLPDKLTAAPLNLDKELAIDTKVKLHGRDTVQGKLELVYPLYTGGKITSIINQAKLNKLLASNTIVRTKEDVNFDVKKYFYGYALTSQLLDIAKNTLDKMQYISQLTKDLYEHGESLNVKKTDYLSSRVTVSLIESIVAKLEANRILVESALINALGLPWDDKLHITYDMNNLVQMNSSLDNLVKDAYENNNDISKMSIILKISDEKIKEKEAGFYPSIAFLADTSHTYNSYEYGVHSKNQEDKWHIGFVAKQSIFDGFKTTNSVKEKKLEKKKVYLLKEMIKEAVALQVKNEFTNSLIAYKQIQVLKKAKKVAKESRELNLRAYQIDAVEPKDMIHSQYVKSYVDADYLKYIHSYLISLAKIEKLIGKELN